jgi:hypothetical protein
MLICGTLVPLKMLLNTNTQVEFVRKDSTGVRVMNLGRRFAETMGDVSGSGNCVKLHYEVVSHLKN